MNFFLRRLALWGLAWAVIVGALLFAGCWPWLVSGKGPQLTILALAGVLVALARRSRP